MLNWLLYTGYSLRNCQATRRPALSVAWEASYGVHDPFFAVTQLAQTSMRSEIGKMTLDRTGWFCQRQINLVVDDFSFFSYMFSSKNRWLPRKSVICSHRFRFRRSWYRDVPFFLQDLWGERCHEPGDCSRRERCSSCLGHRSPTIRDSGRLDRFRGKTQEFFQWKNQWFQAVWNVPGFKFFSTAMVHPIFLCRPWEWGPSGYHPARLHQTGRLLSQVGDFPKKIIIAFFLKQNYGFRPPIDFSKLILLAS